MKGRKGIEIINKVKRGELSDDELREQAALDQVLGVLTKIRTQDGEKKEFSDEDLLIMCLSR